MSTPKTGPVCEAVSAAVHGGIAGLGFLLTLVGVALVHPPPDKLHLSTVAAGYVLAGAGAWSCVLGWCGAVQATAHYLFPARAHDL